MGDPGKGVVDLSPEYLALSKSYRMPPVVTLAVNTVGFAKTNSQLERPRDKTRLKLTVGVHDYPGILSASQFPNKALGVSKFTVRANSWGVLACTWSASFDVFRCVCLPTGPRHQLQRMNH